MDEDGSMVEIWPAKRRRVGSSPQRRLGSERRISPATTSFQFHPPHPAVLPPRGLSEYPPGHLPVYVPKVLTTSVPLTCRPPEQSSSACPTELHPPEDLAKRRAAVSHETRESLFCGQSSGSPLVENKSPRTSTCSRHNKPKKVTDLEKKKIKLDGLQKWYSRSSLDMGQSSSSQSSTSWFQRLRRKKSSETQTSTTTRDSIGEVGRCRNRRSDEAVSRCESKEAEGSIDSSEPDYRVRATDDPMSIDSCVSAEFVKEAGMSGNTHDEEVRMAGTLASGSIDCSEPDYEVRSKSIDSPACEDASTSMETTKMVHAKDTPPECISQNTSTADFLSGNASRDVAKNEAKKIVKFASLDKTVTNEVQKSGEGAQAVCEGDVEPGSKNASAQNALAKGSDNVDEKYTDRTLKMNSEEIGREFKQEGALSGTEETGHMAAREIEETNEKVTPPEKFEGSHQKTDLVADRFEISTEAYRPEETVGVTITVGDPGNQANSMTYLASSEPKLIHSFKFPFDVPGGGFQQNLIVICPQDPSQAPTELNHEPKNKARENPVREEQLNYVPTRQLQQERDGNNQTAGNPVAVLRSNNQVSTVELQQERDSKNQSTQNPVTDLQSDKEVSTVELKQAQDRKDQSIGSQVTEFAPQQESALKAMEDDNKPPTEDRVSQVSDLGSTVGLEQTNGERSLAAEKLVAEPGGLSEQEDNGSISTSQNFPSDVPEKKEQVLQMVNTNPQKFFLAHSNKGTCNKEKVQAKQTGTTAKSYSEIPKSDFDGRELCEAVLAVWKRDKPIASQRDPPQKESSLRNHSREMRHTVITQWKHSPRDHQGSSKERGRDSYNKEPAHHSYRRLKFHHQEPALPPKKVHSSTQESGQGIRLSRAATLEQFSSQKNKNSTTKELSKEIQYPELKSPRFSRFYENCQEELHRWKASFNEKESCTKNRLSVQKNAPYTAPHFADGETIPRRVFQAQPDKQEEMHSARDAQVGSNFVTYAELTAPSTSNEQPVPTESKKVLSWDVSGGNLHKPPAKVYMSLQFPSPELPRQYDTNVLSGRQGLSETMPLVLPPGSSSFAQTMSRSGYETALAQSPRAMSYVPEIVSQIKLDPLSSGFPQSDLSRNVNPPHQASDSSGKKHSQVETKSTTEKSTSCCQVQPPIPAFQSLKKDLPGIDWTPIHIESRLPLSFSKGKSLRSSLPKTEDVIGTPLRRVSYRKMPCGAGESNGSSVGKKTYTPCFAPSSSFQKDSPRGSRNSSLLSENSSSLGCSTCSGTPRSSSDNNSGQNDERKEPSGISFEDSNDQEYSDGVSGGLGPADRGLAISASPEHTLPLAAHHCSHKPRLQNNNASYRAGEVARGCTGELPELSPRRSRSSGDEFRLRQHHRTPKSFSSKESMQSRVSSKSRMSAEDLNPKEDETLRCRSSHRNYKACSFEPPLPSRGSKVVSPPEQNPVLAPLPTALPITSSRSPASMVTPKWSSPPLWEHQSANPTPGIWQQTSLASSLNSTAQSLLATSPTADPFHMPSASNSSAQRMHVVFPVNVPVTSSPSDNLRRPAYESSTQPRDLSSTPPSTDQGDISQSTFVEPMDAFSAPTSTEALPPKIPPSQPLPPEPPPFPQPSVSVSISSLENAPRHFPRAPGQQPVSLVFIPVPTVCTPCPCPTYLPNLQGEMVPEALAVPEPREEIPVPTGEWIMEKPERDVQQEVYEDTLRQKIQQEPDEAPIVGPYQRINAQTEEEEKTRPVKPEEKAERKEKKEEKREKETVGKKEKEEKVPLETRKRKPQASGRWTGVMAAQSSLRFLLLLAIAFALAAAMDVAKDLYMAKPTQKLLDYKNDLRGADRAPRRFFVPYDDSVSPPHPTSPSSGATEPMRSTPSAEDASTVGEAFSGFLPRRLFPEFPQETNQNHTDIKDQELPDKTLNRPLLPAAAQNTRPDEEELTLEEAGSTITKNGENSSATTTEIINNSTSQYVARTDHREQPVTEPLDETRKAATDVVPTDGGDGYRLAQHGSGTHENITPGPTSVPQTDSLQITSPSTQGNSTTSSEEKPISKSEPPNKLETPVSTRIEESNTTSLPSFVTNGSDISVTTSTGSMVGDVLKSTSHEGPENAQVSEDPDRLSPDKMKLKKKSRFYIPKTGDLNKHLDKKSKEIAKLNVSDVESVYFKSPRKRQINLHFESGDIYGNIYKALKHRRNSSKPREATYQSEDIYEEDRNFDEFSDRSQDFFPSFEDEGTMAGGDDPEWDGTDEDYKKREEVLRKMTRIVSPRSDADASDLPEKHAQGRFFGEIRVTVEDAPEGEDSSKGVTKPARRKKPKHRKTDVTSTATTNRDIPHENTRSSTEKSTLPSENINVPQTKVTDFSQVPGISLPRSSQLSAHSTQSLTQTASATTNVPQAAETTLPKSLAPTSTLDLAQSTTVSKTIGTSSAPTGEPSSLNTSQWTSTIIIPTSSLGTTKTPPSSTISSPEKTSTSQKTIESSQVTNTTTGIPPSTLAEIPWTESQINSPQEVQTSKATTIPPPSQDTSIPTGTSTTKATQTTWQPSTTPETSMVVQTSTLQSEPSQLLQNPSPFSRTPPSAEMSTTSATATTATQEIVPKIELPRTSPTTGKQDLVPRFDFREVTPEALPSTQDIVPEFDEREVTPVTEPPTQNIVPRMDAREVTPITEPSTKDNVPEFDPREITPEGDVTPGQPSTTTEKHPDTTDKNFPDDALNIPFDRLFTNASFDLEILYLTIFILSGYAALLLLQIFIAFNGGRNVCQCPFVLFGLIWFVLAGAYYIYRDRKILGAALLCTAFLFFIDAFFLIFVGASRLRT